MSTFDYVAKESSGNRVSGSLVADSERDVLQVLDERGLLPIRIRPARVTKPLLATRRRRKLPGRVMARTYRQLSDLLRSGVPLLRSLDLLARQSSEGDLAQVLTDIRKKVADGEGLAESLHEHDHLFNSLAVSMIKAGQEGGFLEDVLARLADYTEREEELKGKVLGAMAYPIFLLVVGTVVITVLVVFFVPKFEQIFGRLAAKGELPGLTIGLLATSKFLQAYGILLLALIGAIIWAARRWAQTPAGRLMLDRLKITAPKVGTIMRDLAIVRFSRVLGTMLGNGIPILTALRIAKDSCGNQILSQAIADAADNVTSGESLAEPLRDSGCFPRDVIEMVAIAEESNTLEQVLLDISESTERRTTRQLDLFVRLLEPMMLMIMAAVVLMVVAALLLPVMKMSTALR